MHDLFVLSVSYVLQNYNIARSMHVVLHISLVDSSMEPAALLACINPPRIKPYSLFYMQAGLQVPYWLATSKYVNLGQLCFICQLLFASLCNRQPTIAYKEN
jgi:hypothetical protein